MSLHEYLHVLRRSWITIAACTLVGLALASLTLLAQPVLYTATAATYVSVSSVRDVTSASEGSGFAKSLAADLADIADSPYVLDQARERLHLNASDSKLETAITATVPTNGAVVVVQAATPRPRLSAALANAIVVELSYSAARLNPNVGNAASIARTTTIERATIPSTPTSPSIPIDITLGVLTGFALGIFVTLARQALDQRIRTISQVERLTSVPTIGPVSPLQDLADEVVRDIAAQPTSDFRQLRGEIMQQVVGDRVCVIVADVRAGGSSPSAAVALGASFAAARFDTLVIDLSSDTRTAGELHRSVLEVASISDHKRALDSLTTRTQVDHLWFVEKSGAAALDDDSVSSPEMSNLLTAAAARFPIVVISVPALALSALPRPISARAEGVVLACTLDEDVATDVRRAAASLRRGRVRLLAALALTASSSSRLASRKLAARDREAIGA